MFHVDADYIPMRADVAPPHWVTETREQAEALVRSLQEIHQPSNPYCCLQNIHIRGEEPKDLTKNGREIYRQLVVNRCGIKSTAPKS